MAEEKKQESSFEPIPIHLLYDEMIARIEARSADPEYPFFLKDLDAYTHGVPRGELTVIGGRPSEGKTSFGMQLALKNAGNGKDVVYITREDNKFKVLEKMCCNMFSIPNTALKQGELERILDERIPNSLQAFNLLLLDDYGYTFAQLEEIIGKLDPMPDMIFLDYIQLIRNSKEVRASRKDVIEDFMRSCKHVCNKTGVTMVILSQINRTARNERPNMWQLKEAGAIEESADLCLLLHYPWKYEVTAGKEPADIKYENNYVECIIAKQKDGEVGWVKLEFTGCYYRFENWDENDVMPVGVGEDEPYWRNRRDIDE